MDPKQIAAIVSIAGIVGAFLGRWLLPPARKVARGDVDRAHRELQEALAEQKRAEATPSKDDDAAAAARVAAAKKVAEKKAQLSDFLDGIPVGP